MADAVFQEVLEIAVDVSSFQQGLSALETAYTEFLARIAAAGAGVELGGVAAASLIKLNEGIAELQTSFTAFDAEVTTAFTDVDAQLKNLQSSIESTGQAAVDAKAKLAQEQSTSVGTSAGSNISVGNVSNIVGGASDFFGGVSRSVASMNGGLLGMLGYMAAIRVAWSLIGTAIQAVTAIIKAPFELIKTGFEYLSQLQDQSASLQGPIAATVKLSEDLGTNFKLAGDAAKQVALELQDMAISMGLPVQQLEAVFRDVIESGGMHFVQNLQGAVNLARELSIAVMATSTSAEGQRKAMNEIPKLLEGQLSGQSRILTTLHLTNDQWMAIREEGLKHGDLELRLADMLKPYLTVLEDARTRQTALVQMIELQGERMAGAVALPLWQVFLGILEKAQHFLEVNGAAIAQTGTNVSSTVVEMGKFLLEISEALTGTGNLKSLFGAILTSVNNLTGALRLAINLVSTLGHEASTMIQFMGDPANFFSKKAIEDFNTRIDAFEKSYAQKVAQIYKDGDVAAQRAFATSYGDARILQQGTAGSPLDDEGAVKKAKEDFKALQEGYREELAQTRETFKSLDDEIRSQQQAGQITDQVSSAKRIQNKKDEVGAIDALITRYKGLAEGIKGLPDDKGSGPQTKFFATLGLDRQKNERSGTEEVNKITLQQNEEDFRADQEKFRAQLALTKETFAATEADIKARQETGNISFHEATMERVEATRIELDSIQKLVQAYTELANKSGAKQSDVAKFNVDLGHISTAAQTTAKSGITSALAADQQNDERITQAHLARLDQMELAHSRAMLAMYREQASLGMLSKVELFDREVALSKQEHDVLINNLQQEIENAGADTVKKSQLQDQLAAEDQRYTDSVTANTGVRIAIAQKEADDLARLEERNIELGLRLAEQKDKIASHNQALSERMIADSKALASEQVLEASNEVNRAQKNLNEAQTIEQKAIATERLLKAQIDLGNAQLNQIKVGQETPAGNTSGGAASPGEDLASLLDHPFASFKETGAELAVTMGFFAKAASGLVGAIQQGFAQGGVSGAVGGGLGAIGGIVGQLGSAFKSAPIVGAVISGVGEIFSVLGSMFTAAAKRIAADIQKAVTDLMNQYSNGQATLVATISGLEQERAQAISQLSGKKGGQDQLDKLLPQIDQQLAQLRQQQVQVKTTFEQSLAVLQTHSSVIGQILSSWTAINKQVKDYLDAGGDAAKAAQFLSLSLQQQLQTTADSLLTAEDSAIQDAVKLNDLLTQRVNLAQQFAQQEFALRNQDALERSANPAVNAGIAYQLQKTANDAQLTALDQQISLFTSRVNMEKQVFTIASDTAALQSQSNQINLTQLQETLNTWKDMKAVIASIYQNPDGSFALNTKLFSPGTGTTTNNKTVNVGPGAIVMNLPAGVDGQTLAAQLARELSLIGQFGANTSYA